MIHEADPLIAWQEHMSKGQFEAAWRISDRIPPKVWNGSSAENRPVLIRCENGLGDTIQFMRYAALLRKTASRVVVAPQPNLASLMRYAAGIDSIHASGPKPDAGVEIECTELPYMFRTTLKDIPSARYIRLPLIRLPRRKVLRVGLVWAAGTYNPLRSVPLRLFGRLKSISDVKWTSLQQGPAAYELHACQSSLEWDQMAPPDTDAVLVTALRILGLDLVISVDTMVAHLAGTLGKPVWTLLPYDADWRWLRDRDDSPWYPTMRLFRQSRPGRWDEVLDRVAFALSLFKSVKHGRAQGHRPAPFCI